MQSKKSCSAVRTTLDVVGGKWKTLILFFLVERTMRFSELQKAITGITQKMLTQQLRELEKEGLLRRKIYPQVPPKVEYSITTYGRTLIPVLNTMHKWGELHKKNSKTSLVKQKQAVQVLLPQRQQVHNF